MTLQDRLNAFKADFEAGRFPLKPSKEALEIMHRATAELIETGQAQRAKKVGEVAPQFTLRDPEGNDVSSRDLLAKGPLVVSFYRGVWCPLQFRTAGVTGGAARDRPRREPRCNLAADRAEQPQVAA
jgi:AhpC/TSA family